MARVKDLVDPELVDEIVEEIVSELKEGREQKSAQTSLPKPDLIELKSQLENLQKAFEIDEVEIERQVTEKFEELSGQIESNIARLEGQINDLRSAMIRLSGEMRRLKEGKT